jgi:carbonic anhydrase/acetyltransferase-like protein (isoleucine patch superfamily)
MIRPFRGVHPQIHETAFIADSAQIIGDVHIGEQASVWYGTVVRGDMFYIRIGDRTNVQDNCVLHTRTGEKPTILEDEVTIGHSVTLHGCYIERQSLIGIGSILLDDVRVGAQSLVALATETAAKHGYEVEHVQSNHEGVLIDAIHAARGRCAAIVFNPGAFSHYAYALTDALAMFDGVKIEVHLSNPYARERWRRHSVISPVVNGTITGIKSTGYRLAIEAVAAQLEERR